VSRTPGPWKNKNGLITAYEPTVDKQITVCDVAPERLALTKFDKANAALIAAAPELLGALEDAIQMLKDYAAEGGVDGYFNYPPFNEIIKKAKGEL
jgi:hypothetical protein